MKEEYINNFETVGDFAGLTVEQIAGILNRRKEFTMADVYRKAAEWAESHSTDNERTSI